MNLASATISLLILLVNPVSPAYSAAQNNLTVQEVRSHQTFDLSQRYGNPEINEIYADNIRLYLHYLKGDAAELTQSDKSRGARRIMNWESVRRPFSLNLTLTPGEVLVFHPGILKEFQGRAVKEISTTFGATDGYRFTGGLWGNGVCHIASFINWVASEAGLKVTAKVGHSFAPIYGVPSQYGTAIYYEPGQKTSNENQNLYVENTFPNPITIVVAVDNNIVEMLITETVGVASVN